jgi:peptidoglycan/LPS O-acetylase OafA/YrhL
MLTSVHQNSKGQHMRYRPEVDGLRAVAVLPVIFYHAGFSLFSGGFVGVDIFFVISGFLITTILLNELAHDRFSLLSFYERRARRIFPALFVVLAVSTVAALFALYPDDLNDFASSLISTIAFVSNFYFWRHSSYFDTAAELKPLLHTWSLSVEEQFYLFFPIALLLAVKYFRRWLLLVLVTSTCFSLVLAQFGSANFPTLSFYLLPTRIWELLLGGIVAHMTTQSKSRRIPDIGLEVAGLMGLAMITYSIFFFDKHVPFPSLYALLPTVGAALLLYAAHDRSIAGRILSFGPMVRIGLISYSAYLWHNPIFSFARNVMADEPSKFVFLALIIFSLGLSYFTWRFVEQPFRSNQINRRILLAFSVVGIASFVASGLFLSRVEKGTSLTAEEKNIYSYISYDFKTKARYNSCFLDSTTQKPAQFEETCRNTGLPQKKVLVWGDSHAAALTIGLRMLHRNVAQFTSNSCPPLIGREFMTAANCKQINDFVLSEIERVKPDLVILDSYWTTYGKNRIAEVIQTLKQIKVVSPSTSIVIVGNVPVWEAALPLLMLKYKIGLDVGASRPLRSYGDIMDTDRFLESLAIANGARFVSALDAFCLKSNCVMVTNSTGVPSLTAYDYGHLTAAGSRVLAAHVLKSVDIVPSESP